MHPNICIYEIPFIKKPNEKTNPNPIIPFPVMDNKPNSDKRSTSSDLL